MGAYKIRQTSDVHPVIARLVKARCDRNLSQAALAERLAVSQGQISHWEAGRRDISLTQLDRWATALGLAVDAVRPDVPDGPLAELIAGGLS